MRDILVASAVRACWISNERVWENQETQPTRNYAKPKIHNSRYESIQGFPHPRSSHEVLKDSLNDDFRDDLQEELKKELKNNLKENSHHCTVSK